MYFVLWILMLKVSIQLRISSVELTYSHQKNKINYISDAHNQQKSHLKNHNYNLGPAYLFSDQTTQKQTIPVTPYNPPKPTTPSYSTPYTNPSYSTSYTNPSYSTPYTNPSYSTSYTNPSYSTSYNPPKTISSYDPPKTTTSYNPPKTTTASYQTNANVQKGNQNIFQNIGNEFLEIQAQSIGIDVGKYIAKFLAAAVSSAITTYIGIKCCKCCCCKDKSFCD